MIYRYYRPKFGISKAIRSAVELRKNQNDAHEQNLYEIANKLEYKQYPYQITHYDPEHHDYVPSSRDDYKQRLKIDTYNMIVARVKNDVEMQKKVDEALKNLDRPYLRGRPGLDKNVSGGLKDYFPVNTNHEQIEDAEDDWMANDYVFRNEKRWIAQTIYPDTSYLGEANTKREKELANRPVNPHFHPDKGSKYDVETPYHQRFPYLADRLGHPEFLANPVQRLFRLESDIYHPNYNDQPFVQHPSAEPDPTLNFEEGEVIYENTRLQEWLKFWWWAATLSFGWYLWALPYNVIYKTNLMFDRQIDASFYPYHLHSIHNFDYMRLHVLGVAATAAYAWYFHHMAFKIEGKRYITKMQYNKDKELIFVTRMGSYGIMYEDVYEAHHLEMTPYFAKSGVQEMRNVDLGMYEVSCYNKTDIFYLYKDTNYWNPKLKKEFLTNHSQLITKEYFGLKRNEQKRYSEHDKIGELPTQDLPIP